MIKYLHENMIPFVGIAGSFCHFIKIVIIVGGFILNEIKLQFPAKYFHWLRYNLLACKNLRFCQTVFLQLFFVEVHFLALSDVLSCLPQPSFLLVWYDGTNQCNNFHKLPTERQTHVSTVSSVT